MDDNLLKAITILANENGENFLQDAKGFLDANLQNLTEVDNSLSGFINTDEFRSLNDEDKTLVKNTITNLFKNQLYVYIITTGYNIMSEQYRKAQEEIKQLKQKLAETQTSLAGRTESQGTKTAEIDELKKKIENLERVAKQYTSLKAFLGMVLAKLVALNQIKEDSRKKIEDDLHALRPPQIALGQAPAPAPAPQAGGGHRIRARNLAYKVLYKANKHIYLMNKKLYEGKF